MDSVTVIAMVDVEDSTEGITNMSMDKDTKQFLVSKLCNTGISVIAVLMTALLGANVPLPM